MHLFGFVAYALTAALTSFAVSQVPVAGPISGIATANFGTGVGFGAPPILFLGWDPANHALDVKISTPSASQPGAPIGAHFVAYGVNTLPAPFPLPQPFWQPGAEFYIDAIEVLGPAFGAESKIGVPQDPALVGQVFYLQAIPEYALLTPLPVYGATQGVKLQFQ